MVIPLAGKGCNGKTIFLGQLGTYSKTWLGLIVLSPPAWETRDGLSHGIHTLVWTLSWHGVGTQSIYRYICAVMASVISFVKWDQSRKSIRMHTILTYRHACIPRRQSAKYDRFQRNRYFGLCYWELQKSEYVTLCIYNTTSANSRTQDRRGLMSLS